MPFSYSKPEIYGFVQAGLRRNMKMGRYRSYMHTESIPMSITTKAMKMMGVLDNTVGAKVWMSQKTCTGIAFCRHLVRDQDVNMDTTFIEKSIQYIKEHYVSNKDMREPE